MQHYVQDFILSFWGNRKLSIDFYEFHPEEEKQSLYLDYEDFLGQQQKGEAVSC